MPDVNYGITLSVSKGFLATQINANNVTANMSVAGMKSDTYTLSTNATSIVTANLTEVGLAFVRNISTATAATAQIGISAGGSFVPFTTLRAGEPQLFRMATGTNYSAIGSAGARLRVDILEG